MRVAYLVSRFPSTTETFVAREMRAIGERGIDVTLFALLAQDDAIVHPESRGFEVLSAGPVTSMRALAWWLRRDRQATTSAIGRALRECATSPAFAARALAVLPMACWFAREAVDRDIEHVHAHWATHSGLAAWMVHRLTGIPYSVTAHAHDIYVDHTMLTTKLTEASFVATISEHNRAYLAQHCGGTVADHTHVVHCGIDPERYARPHLPHSGPLRLSCVASLQDYKGHRHLLDAFAALLARGHDATLTLVGDGPLRAELGAQARRLGISSAVTFRGALPSRDVEEILSATEIFVLPSIVTSSGKMEGIPVALMEAMASGIPVVASDISGIPELVVDGTTGLLVPPADAAALAEALDRLAGDDLLRQRLGQAGRRKVTAEFTSDVAADQLVRLFTGTTMAGAAHE